MSDSTRSYALPTETIPGLDLSHYLNDLLEIRTFLESRGIATKNTRIERYGHFFEQLLSGSAGSVDAEKVFKTSCGEPFRTPVDWQLYFLREVHELMWILKGLKAHVPLGADEKLKVITGGRDFATLDTDSQSRNAQFELRIASYFCQSGCKVDISTATDVVAVTDRYAFFVECKRISSASKLRARLSEARRQLAQRTTRDGRRQRLLGCIAVDVTKVAFPHNGLTWALTSEHSRDEIQSKLISITSNAKRHMSFETCPKLLCYWLQIHIPALIMQPLPGGLTTRFSSYRISRPLLNRKDGKILAAFHQLFESVSQRDPRTPPSQVLTPRNTVDFPAGTKFNLHDVRVAKLLDQDATSEEERAEIIGTLSFDGLEDSFTFFEVSLLPDDLISEWRSKTSLDHPTRCFMLLAPLFQHRYPYEESERIARPGLTTVVAVNSDRKSEDGTEPLAID